MRAPRPFPRRALSPRRIRPPSTTKMTRRRHGGVVEAHAELGVDLGGQGAETQDLEGTELGQHHQGHQHRSPENGQTGLADGHPPKGAQPSQPEAPGHLFLGGIGVAQAGRHRQEDQRVDGHGHDQGGGPEAAEGREDGPPAEAHDEVGYAQGDHHQHGPEPAARDVGALDEPGRQCAHDGAEERDHHGKADGVPEQLRRQAPEGGAPVLHPTCAACTIKKTIGRITATEATNTPRTRRCGGWPSRPGATRECGTSPLPAEPGGRRGRVRP